MKKCFVVMGFGEKTDLATGRTLDLDKTYRIIIKKAVETAGLECIRADDVIHSGTIDRPMYELLLEADIVIADLSTSNANGVPGSAEFKGSSMFLSSLRKKTAAQCRW